MPSADAAPGKLGLGCAGYRVIQIGTKRSHPQNNSRGQNLSLPRQMHYTINLIMLLYVYPTLSPIPLSGLSHILGS